MRFTPVIKTLLIINLVFYALTFWITPMFPLDGYRDWFMNFNQLYPINSPGFHWYQFITYMFMHGGWWHLFFNMWSLMIFGNAVEEVLGSKRFAIYYLLCGIGSAAFHQLFAILGIVGFASVVGASGAIYGVMAAAAFYFPDAKMFIIPFPFPIKLKWLVALFAGYDLFSGLTSMDGVAHFAHIGGLVIGLVILFYWKYKDANRRSSGDYWTTSGSYDSDDDSLFGKIKEAFRSKPKMTVVKNAGDRKSDYEYNERKKAHNDEIDRILDKVRKGGFENLTEDEKRTLFDASKR